MASAELMAPHGSAREWKGQGLRDEEARGVLALLRLSLMGLAPGRGWMNEAQLVGGVAVEGQMEEADGITRVGRRGRRPMPFAQKVARMVATGLVELKAEHYRITEKGLEYLLWIEELELETDE